MKLANSPSQLLLHLVFCILLASCGSTQSTKTVETTNQLEEYRAAEANYSGDTDAELQLILADLDSLKTAEVTNKLFQKALAFKKNKMEFSALKYLEKAAELGSANSQWYLADYYMDGIIVGANNERAVELLTDAAIQGHHQAQLDLGYYNGRGDLGLPQDYLRAKYWYEKSAANGNAIAFNNLGVLYRDGKGVTQSNAKALENFSTAIEYGYEEAYCKLGNMFLYIPELQDVEKAEQLLVEGARIQKTDCYYDLGYLYDEVLQQYKLAAYYYLQAIEYDHAAAESNLGLLFQDGTGVEQSDETAFKLFQSAADKGNPPAMVNLARAYENGTGTPVDYAKAIEWYKTAIKKGSDQAVHNLGSMYNKGLGIEKNRQKAISLFQKAAENNNRFSLFNLANAYRTGYGLPQDFSKSVEHYIKSFQAGYSPALNEVHSLATALLEDGDKQQESLQWLEEAMDLGNPRAALELAQIYHFGKFGIAADHQKAFGQYEKAIEGGSAVAAANLGFWYESGNYVEADQQKAYDLYVIAAEGGSAQGQNNLGTFYLNGWIVEQDTEKARELYEAAAEQDNGFALKNLGEMYLWGDGVEPDLQLAYQYFMGALKVKHPVSDLDLGVLYSNADFELMDLEKAEKFFRAAIAREEPQAHTWFGEMLYLNYDEPDRIQEALDVLEAGAAANDPFSADLLGQIYYFDEKVPADFPLAAYWFEKARDEGVYDNVENLAGLYWHGKGVTEDKEKAITILTTRAQEEGFNPASYLGEHYYYGSTIDQDYSEAKRYFEEAVLDLDDIAFNLLGNIYRDGNDVEADEERAFELYKAAAKLDNDDAMYNLATAYLLGEGTAKDESMAFFWMEKASHSLYLVEPLLELSLMYRDGIGTESNPEKALEYLELAADAGLAEARFMFAKHLLTTSEDKADMKYAVDILVELVAEDYQDAIEFLDNM